MRIIGGRLGGRQFDSPKSFKTHPMSDKIRGALFNMLGDINALTVLDAFSGSGALSFEAVSRGARQAVAIDNDRAAQAVIAANIHTLALDDHIRLVTTSANTWLRTTPAVQFDIVLCDPPYNDLQVDLITRLSMRVQPDGILVLSLPSKQEPPELPGLQRIETRIYGDASLVFYRG